MTDNKSTLKTFFQDGDIPTGTNYSDLIDSNVNLVETVEQDMAGPLSTTKLITPRVSAANANFTNIVSAATLNGNTIMGTNATFGIVSANSINVAADVSAAQGTVYTSAIRTVNGLYALPVIISAAGTALATATNLTARINRVQGVADGQTTGVKLLSGQLGWEQTIINETATSANLWPAGSDFKINALASGAAFSMAGNTMYIAVYSQTSAYSVK